MSSDNGSGGMLRRMVSLVAGNAPPRETGLPQDAGASQFASVEKAELKAMIERKRRNDFVRKREFDMLRRIRREGLTGDQVPLLDTNSRLDDPEIKPTQLPDSMLRSVKAKIDAIEKQMVGGAPTAPMPHTSRPEVMRPPMPGGGMPRAQAAAAASPRPPLPAADASLAPTRPMALPSTLPAEFIVGGEMVGSTRPMEFGDTHPVVSAPPAPSPKPAAVHASARPAPGMAPPTLQPERALTPTSAAAAAKSGQLLFSQTGVSEIEVSEIAHDHELDEPVIAFANADFAHCERLMVQLISRNGTRHTHVDTWLVLFDFYRATGQQARFDTLSGDYTQQFQRSTPQWFSLPKLVMEASAQQGQQRADGNGEVGWVCPSRLDQEGLAQLNSKLMQLPQPWVLDWRLLMLIEADTASRLQELFAQWARQTVEMRWLNSDRLLSVMQESTPVGVRDVDPAYWLSRLEALRLANRADQFDEVAIDYCVTYEVSPPSWEPAKCTVRLGDSKVDTHSAPLSVIGDPVTSLLESALTGDLHAITTLELSGQLSGDISAVLAVLDSRLGESTVLHISCALLIRVDFIAAGDLLNWVIAKRAEGRHISFTEVHRLVALMFGAMGIAEHATVRLRLS